MSLNINAGTELEKLHFKKRLLEACLGILKDRMKHTAAQVDNAQRAANSEEKSSAGDKYETSRAMSHLEKDMFSKQLLQTRQELASLMEINCSQVSLLAAKGAVVISDPYIFFLAAGIGKLQFEEHTILVLSPLAPMGRLLLGKKAGDELIFDSRELLIREVF